jgi:hypothetical protein
MSRSLVPYISDGDFRPQPIHHDYPPVAAEDYINIVNNDRAATVATTTQADPPFVLFAVKQALIAVCVAVGSFMFRLFGTLMCGLLWPFGLAYVIVVDGCIPHFRTWYEGIKEKYAQRQRQQATAAQNSV